MNDTFPVESPAKATSVIRAIAIGTIAVTLLDATDGVVYYWLTAHLNPIEVLQYIASGAFGAASFNGGLATAFAGLVFHVVISLLAVTAFAIGYERSRFIRTYAPASGLAYGAAVWCFMNLVVLPMSAVEPTALTPLFVIHGLIGHALFVGLPAAWAARTWLR